ncbi:hypothetical protein QOT17_022597 [Balamuthia mandrillaris]
MKMCRKGNVPVLSVLTRIEYLSCTVVWTITFISTTKRKGRLLKEKKNHCSPAPNISTLIFNQRNSTMKLSTVLLLIASVLALLAIAHAQDGEEQQPGPANCQVKVVHLLSGGTPIDVRVGEQLVAANLAFLRSQTSQPNVPCGLQNVQLFASGMENSFRSENFALAEGENVYNYIVFGGEIREPTDTNVFLLSHEAVAMPNTPSGQINIAFWHYAPVARQDQIQLDVLSNNESVLSTIANFQQRTNYQPIPSAESLTFRFSNLALEELFEGERSVAALRNSGAGTVFALGQNATELFLEADPAIMSGSDGADPSQSGSESQDGGFPIPPPTDGGDLSESSGSLSLSDSLDDSNPNSGASSLSSFFF